MSFLECYLLTLLLRFVISYILRQDWMTAIAKQEIRKDANLKHFCLGLIIYIVYSIFVATCLYYVTPLLIKYFNLFN